MNICITGADGQLGKTFRELAPAYPEWQFHFAGRQEADLADPDSVSRWFDERGAEVVINCAAYTNVNQAESEPEPARAINVDAVVQVAEYCGERSIPFLHYSSDYVYHLQQGVPFRESDATVPKGVYAKTKLEGEQRALAIYPASTIIRTSWVYSPYGSNFLKTMLRLGQERTELKVVYDQIGTPTYTFDLAAATMSMLTRWRYQGADLSGVFNYSNEGVGSWYDFTLAIFELSNIRCRVLPVESHEFPSPVERPPFSVLNKSKIKHAFGLEIPHWRIGVKRCLTLLAKQINN
jgi:dTDP-4-dehydrorhamnose reductase